MSQSWKHANLGDVCEIYQPKTISQKEMSEDGAYPVFGANGQIGRYHKFNHEAPQLLITCRGATCGSVNVSLPHSWITGNAMVVRPKCDDIDPKFLEYYFRGAVNLEGVITGAAQPQITRKSLAPVDITIPPLEEQKRIVAVLDQAFASLDRARANAEANLADAEGLLGATIASVFASSADGSTLPLGEVSDFAGGSQPPKSQFIDTPREGYVRLLQIRDFSSEDKAVYIPDDGKRRRCAEDDIMIARYGASVGQIHRGKSGCYNVALIRTSPDTNIVDRDFFYYYLKSDLFQKPLLARSSRGAQDGFNKGDITDLPVPVPPLPQQVEMVGKIAAVEEQSRLLEARFTESLRNLDYLRQSLLQKAFAGGLT